MKNNFHGTITFNHDEEGSICVLFPLIDGWADSARSWVYVLNTASNVSNTSIQALDNDQIKGYDVTIAHVEFRNWLYGSQND